jgi:hypothetical protein
MNRWFIANFDSVSAELRVASHSRDEKTGGKPETDYLK